MALPNAHVCDNFQMSHATYAKQLAIILELYSISVWPFPYVTTFKRMLHTTVTNGKLKKPAVLLSTVKAVAGSPQSNQFA